MKIFNVNVPEDVLALLDKLANDAGISRKRLVELILNQVVNDPKFVLEV